MNTPTLLRPLRLLRKPLYALFIVLCVLCVVGFCESQVHRVTGHKATPTRPASPHASQTPTPTPSPTPPPLDPVAPPQTLELVPDVMLNPTVTQDTISTTICVTGWTKTVRPPADYTEALKKAQIAASNYSDKKLSDYEEDHFIALEIGGAPNNEANLWPEPRAGAGGAGDKDSEENALHRAVCAGTMSLAAAQSKMYEDYVGQYSGWR